MDSYTAEPMRDAQTTIGCWFLNEHTKLGVRKGVDLGGAGEQMRSKTLFKILKINKNDSKVKIEERRERGRERWRIKRKGILIFEIWGKVQITRWVNPHTVGPGFLLVEMVKTCPALRS